MQVQTYWNHDAALGAIETVQPQPEATPETSLAPSLGCIAFLLVVLVWNPLAEVSHESGIRVWHPTSDNRVASGIEAHHAYLLS